MLNTFTYTVLSVVREKSILFWVLLFPIILSTLFNLMFSNIEEEAYTLDPIPVAIVDNAEGEAGTSFNQMVDALSDADAGLLDARAATTHDEALKALYDGDVVGIVTLDAQGWPSLEVSPFPGDVSVSMEGVSRTILADVVGNYVRTRQAVEDIASDNPAVLADPEFMDSLVDAESYTEKVLLTHSKALEHVRYFYALLGFAALMAAMVSLQAISQTVPNASPLGARRAVGGTSRIRTLIGTVAASWVLCFAALLVAFAYIRFVLRIDFGDRDLLCMVGIGVASLMSTALGALVGALPRIPASAKSGILTGITCFLSLFAGLYGTPSMRLADEVARDFPVLASLNPAKLVSDLFYSLYVYTDTAPFFQTAGVLLVLTVAFAAVAVLFMRRQRYESL